VARRYFVPERLNRVIIAPPGGAPKPTQQAAKATEGEIREVRLPNGLRVLLKRIASFRWSTSKHSSWAAHWPTTNRRRSSVAGSRDARYGHGRPHGPADRRVFRLHRRTSDHERGRSPSSAAPRRCAAILPAPWLCSPSASRGRRFRKRSTPRCNGGLGAIARRADDPHQEISELFADSLPASSPYHIIQGGKADTVGKLTAKICNSTTPSISCRTTWWSRSSATSTRRGVGTGQETLRRPETIARFPAALLRSEQCHRQDDRAPQDNRQANGHATVRLSHGKHFRERRLCRGNVIGAVMAGYHYPADGCTPSSAARVGLFRLRLSRNGAVPGYFEIVAQTRPDKLDEVVRRIERNVERAKAGKISEDEFRTAQQRVIALHAQDGTTIGEQPRRPRSTNCTAWATTIARHLTPGSRRSS